MDHASTLAPGMRLAGAALAALAGGLLWQALGWPLPWVTGALVGTACLAMTRFPVSCPPLLFLIAQWLIGAAVGARFTPAAAAQLTAHAGAMVVATVFSLALGLLLAWLLRHWARLDAATAFLAAMPGVSGEMARLAHEHGARADQVALVQTVRLCLVVILVPPAFRLLLPGLGSPVPDPATHEVPGQMWLLLIALGGGWSLKRLIGGTGWFVGALVAAAAATALGVPVAAPAPALADTAQLLLGWSLGSRFRRESLARLPRLLVTSTILNVAAIGASALLGILLARRWGLSVNSAILGAIPGGIAEMCITAASLGEPVAIVAAFHVVRVLGLLLTVPLLLRRMTKANH
jgi:hypothetical protein